jgi:hypothetical protein
METNSTRDTHPCMQRTPTHSPLACANATEDTPMSSLLLTTYTGGGAPPLVLLHPPAGRCWRRVHSLRSSALAAATSSRPASLSCRRALGSQWVAGLAGCRGRGLSPWYTVYTCDLAGVLAAWSPTHRSADEHRIWLYEKCATVRNIGWRIYSRCAILQLLMWWKRTVWCSCDEYVWKTHLTAQKIISLAAPESGYFNHSVAKLVIKHGQVISTTV